MKVLVTGKHGSLPRGLKVRGESVEWLPWEVLRFEAVPVGAGPKGRISAEPPDWILFTSPRAVSFWMEAFGGLPSRSRIAAIGRATTEALSGFVAFTPSDSGSESFLEEFKPEGGFQGLRILIPGAEDGRRLIADQLTAKGANVERLVLYRTFPREQIDPIPQGVGTVILTSPSSVEAILAKGALPKGVRLISMGKFTSESLKRHGLADFREVPGGDLARVGEIL